VLIGAQVLGELLDAPGNDAICTSGEPVSDS